MANTSRQDGLTLRENGINHRVDADGSCCCGTGSPCYHRGDCVFSASPVSPFLEIGSLHVKSAIALSTPDYTADTRDGTGVIVTPPTGSEDRWVVVFQSGTFVGYVAARLWVRITEDVEFELELKTYDTDGETVLTTATATVQGTCSGVFKAEEHDNRRWYDRSGDETNDLYAAGTDYVPAPEGKAVTWSTGEGTFLWADSDACDCANKRGRYLFEPWREVTIPGEDATVFEPPIDAPTTCVVKFEDVVGTCADISRSGGAPSYARGVGTFDGTYTLGLYRGFYNLEDGMLYEYAGPVPSGLGIERFGATEPPCTGPSSTYALPSSWTNYEKQLVITAIVRYTAEFTGVEVYASTRFRYAPPDGPKGAWIGSYFMFYSRKTCHLPGERFHSFDGLIFGNGTAELTFGDGDLQDEPWAYLYFVRINCSTLNPGVVALASRSCRTLTDEEKKWRRFGIYPDDEIIMFIWVQGDTLCDEDPADPDPPDPPTLGEKANACGDEYYGAEATFIFNCARVEVEQNVELGTIFCANPDFAGITEWVIEDATNDDGEKLIIFRKVVLTDVRCEEESTTPTIPVPDPPTAEEIAAACGCKICGPCLFGDDTKVTFDTTIHFPAGNYERYAGTDVGRVFDPPGLNCTFKGFIDKWTSDDGITWTHEVVEEAVSYAPADNGWTVRDNGRRINGGCDGAPAVVDDLVDGKLVTGFLTVSDNTCGGGDE